MFNSSPEQPPIPFSQEEQLENKLRISLTSLFESIGNYEGHEPAIKPRIGTIRSLLSEVKDQKTLQVIITEAAASVTSEITEQLALIQKLSSALEAYSAIDNAKK